MGLRLPSVSEQMLQSAAAALAFSVASADWPSREIRLRRSRQIRLRLAWGTKGGRGRFCRGPFLDMFPVQRVEIKAIISVISALFHLEHHE